MEVEFKSQSKSKMQNWTRILYLYTQRVWGELNEGTAYQRAVRVKKKPERNSKIEHDLLWTQGGERREDESMWQLTAARAVGRGRRSQPEGNHWHLSPPAFSSAPIPPTGQKHLEAGGKESPFLEFREVSIPGPKCKVTGEWVWGSGQMEQIRP